MNDLLYLLSNQRENVQLDLWYEYAANDQHHEDEREETGY